MINWADELLNESDSDSQASPTHTPPPEEESPFNKPEKTLTKTTRREPKTALKKHPSLERELSVV